MDSEIQQLAEELYKSKSLLIMGRGHNYATCLEGALVSLDQDFPKLWVFFVDRSAYQSLERLLIILLH